jgi:hypothetical protein
MLRRNFARLGQLAFRRPSSSSTPASKPSMWSIGKYFIVKPFVYASVYSASTAAVSLALLSAPQLAAAPLVAKAAVVLANSSAAFGVGSAHGSLNGAHQLLVNDRVLAALLPMGQVFDFLKSKSTKRLDMEASKAAAAKIKDALLDPKFIPRVLRPAAGFIVELVLPVSTICAIPEHIEKVEPGCLAAIYAIRASCFRVVSARIRL